MIAVNGITKHFGATVAVDDVSFNVKRGEIVGFLGPNGAGKSTTMKILTCYLAPTSGTASIDGHDILDDPLGARARIGYLPESTPLYDEMGVLDFLRFTAKLHGLSGSAARDRVDELVKLCGIGRMAHKDIGELSKGFRQRVGLAHALMHDPPVLVLDEPTSGLDPAQIVEIRELIKRIAKEKAILFSTHILPEAQNTCHRILIINNGQVVGEGTNEELMEMASGEELFKIVLKGSVDNSVSQALGRLPRVKECTKDSTNGEARFKLTAERGSDLREAIFDFAVQHNLKLLELEHASTSLEDVFLAITRGEQDTLDAEPVSGGGEDE